MDKRFSAIIKESVPLSRHTTLRIGGPARWWAEPTTQGQLIELLRHAEVDTRMLGGGSNTLVSDEGFNGMIISSKKIDTIEFLGRGRVKVGCGVKLPYLVRECCNRGLGGIEYLSHIPGTVGGAILNNAGLSGENCMGNRVLNVEIWDGSAIQILGRDELCFDYRHSIFLSQNNWVILGATLQLSPQPIISIKSAITQHFRTVVASHDHSGPNAGSVFVGLNQDTASKSSSKSSVRWSHKRPNWIIADPGTKCCDLLNLLSEYSSDYRLEWQTV